MHPDIFIIVTDSARAFFSHSNDDRERPEFYDLLKDFNYCKNAYTSAPSSVMSGAAMISSVDSYMTSRNYDDFRFNNNFKINNIEKIKSLGYETSGFFVARELREKLGRLVGFSKDYKLDRLKFSERMWSNEDLNICVDNYLKKKKNSDTPLMSLIWNNIRHDDSISENLLDLMNILKKNNKWDDSIIFFLSDHGYPVAEKGITPEGLKKDGKTHDLWLTEDNIRIPFYFRTNSNSPTKTIFHNVSTIDIFPTIFDVLGVDFNNNFSDGISLFNISSKINKKLEERTLRVDSRFIGQPMRKTAIIYKDYKYVKNYDDNKNELQLINHDKFSEERDDSNNEMKLFLASEYSLKEKKAVFYQYALILFFLNKKDKKFSIVLGRHDKYLLDYLDSLENISILKRVESIYYSKFLSDLFKKNLVFINVESSVGILNFLLNNFLKKFKKIKLMDEQEVLVWSFKRYYRAIKAASYYIFLEPSYLYVRIKELIK